MPHYNYKTSLVTVPQSNKQQFSIDLIREKARGSWHDILESLGVPAPFLQNKHGACPKCGGKDRFRFDNLDGFGTFYCNKCGAGDGFKFLQVYHSWSFSQALEMVGRVLRIRPDGYVGYPKRVDYYLHNMGSIIERPKITIEEIAKRKKKLNLIWQAASPVALGDPVDYYLRSRGIALEAFPRVLRFHPRLPYYNEDKTLVGTFPAMLALVEDGNNRNVTLHRTYLTDGCKADVPKPKKLMLPIAPRATNGAAIKLFDPVNGVLALSEGIENALSYYVATNSPAWAVMSAGGMEKVILPPSITTVIVLVDNDDRGRQAALIIAQKLISEGRSVKRVVPPGIGQDFNDVLQGVGS